MTRTTKRQIRQKHRAYNPAKKSNKDEDWANFRKLRKKVQNSLKMAHWDLFEYSNDGNNKGLWRYLKGMRKDTCGVGTLVADERLGTDPQDKADMLNKQFSSAYTREDRLNVPRKEKSPHPKMPPIKVSSNGVFKFLNQLNQKKASSPDEIPAVFLKTCSAELTYMLTFII